MELPANFIQKGSYIAANDLLVAIVPTICNSPVVGASVRVSWIKKISCNFIITYLYLFAGHIRIVKAHISVIGKCSIQEFNASPQVCWGWDIDGYLCTKLTYILDIWTYSDLKFDYDFRATCQISSPGLSIAWLYIFPKLCNQEETHPAMLVYLINDDVIRLWSLIEQIQGWF